MDGSEQSANQLYRGRRGSSRRLSAWLICGSAIGGLLCAPAAGDPAAFSGVARIDREVQTLKHEVLEINREIAALEEELLYPPEQQLLVFLSVAQEAPVAVNHLRIGLDARTLVRHDYTKAEIAALQKGGIHRVFLGRVRQGMHQFEAFLSGTDSQRRAFERRVGRQFVKVQAPMYLELRIEPGNQDEPGFSVYER